MRKNLNVAFKSHVIIMTTKNYIASWCKSFRLPGVHEDYDEEVKKKLIKEGKYDSYNFDEEDLEKDDYHYEDDN